LNDLFGGSGNDALIGGTDADSLNGGSGDDALSGGDGNDVLKGGTGHDDLQGDDGKDKLYGGSGNDTISGDDGKDYINAGTGDDVIFGGANNDKIFSGAGNDIINGGSGSDQFVFRSDDLGGYHDEISDFRRSGGEQDRLDLRLLNLASIGQTDTDWITQNVTQNVDNSLTITIGNSYITLADSYEIGAVFIDEVTDGLLI